MHDSRWLVIVSLLLSLGIYLHSIRYFFRRDHGIEPSMRALGLAGFIATISQIAGLVLSLGPSAWRVALGMGFYTAALLVFRAAARATQVHRLTLAFSRDQPTYLIQQGIYARIRHPFYLAYLLTWLGVPAVVTTALTVVPVIVMLAFYISAAKQEEEKFAASSFAAEYCAYRRRAGLLLPAFLAE